MSEVKKIIIKSRVLYDLLTENKKDHNYVLLAENTEVCAKDVGSKTSYVPSASSTNSKKSVEGKDLVVGHEYFKSDKDIYSLGTFVGKYSEYMMEASYASSGGYEHFYVFKNEYREQRTRDYDGSETFYEKV